MYLMAVKISDKQNVWFQKKIDSGLWASNSHAVRCLIDFYRKNYPVIQKLKKENYHLREVLNGQTD